MVTLHPNQPFGVDLHVDTLWRLAKKGGSFRTERPDLHLDVPRLRAAGIRLLLTACFTTDDDPNPAHSVECMLEVSERIRSEPNAAVTLVVTPPDCAELRADQIGMLLTIENGRSLEGRLERLDDWFRRGVRILGITWNGANELADGVMVKSPGGLTPFGHEVVREAARLRMAVDISHLAGPGVLDVLAYDVPVVATHSNARAVWDHPRNLSDEQLRVLAEHDGLVGVNVYPPFLGTGTVTLETVVEHVVHIAQHIGPHRVALGTDLDGIEEFPDGFTGYQDLPRLDELLARAGWSGQARQGFFGRNFLDWWDRWSA